VWNAEQALAAIRSLLSEKAVYGDAGWGSFLGDGMLLCRVCGGPVRGETSAYEWGRDLRTASYRCVTDSCRQVLAPVYIVDGELQRLTRERLSDPAVVDGWRAKRVHEIDWSVATGRQVWAWLADPEHARQLARLAGKDLQPTMQALRDRMVAVATERARLVPSGWGRPVTDLAAASHECGTYRNTRRSRERHDRFWGLLAETTWVDPIPAVHPKDDPTLWEDWASVDTNTPRRRELVSIAVNGVQIGLNPTDQHGGHLWVPPGG
jgi:hypothetical protein